MNLKLASLSAVTLLTSCLAVTSPFTTEYLERVIVGGSPAPGFKVTVNGHGFDCAFNVIKDATTNRISIDDPNKMQKEGKGEHKDNTMTFNAKDANTAEISMTVKDQSDWLVTLDFHSKKATQKEMKKSVTPKTYGSWMENPYVIYGGGSLIALTAIGVGYYTISKVKKPKSKPEKAKEAVSQKMKQPLKTAKKVVVEGDIKKTPPDASNKKGAWSGTMATLGFGKTDNSEAMSLASVGTATAMAAVLLLL